MTGSNQAGIVFVQPVRICLPECCPLIRGALCEAFQINELVVEIHAALAGAALEWIVGTPKARLSNPASCGEDLRCASSYLHWIAVEARTDVTALIDNDDREADPG